MCVGGSEKGWLKWEMGLQKTNLYDLVGKKIPMLAC